MPAVSYPCGRWGVLGTRRARLFSRRGERPRQKARKRTALPRNKQPTYKQSGPLIVVAYDDTHNSGWINSAFDERGHTTMICDLRRRRRVQKLLLLCVTCCNECLRQNQHHLHRKKVCNAFSVQFFDTGYRAPPGFAKPAVVSPASSLSLSLSCGHTREAPWQSHEG